MRTSGKIFLVWIIITSLATGAQKFWSLPITTETVHRIANYHCGGSSTYRYVFPTIDELRKNRASLARIIKDFDKFELPPFVWSSDVDPNDPKIIKTLNVETGEVKAIQTEVPEGTYGPYAIVLCVCRMATPRPNCSYKDAPEKGYVFFTEEPHEPDPVGPEPQVVSPERLLELAQSDTAAFVKALSEAEPVVVTFSEGAKLFPYLRILDSLKMAISGASGSVSLEALSRFSRIVTRNAVKFIVLDREDADLVSALVRWADDDTRGRLASLHIKLALTVTDRIRAMDLQKAASRALDLLRPLAPQPFVIDEFEQLEAVIVGRLLSPVFSMSDQEISSLVSQLGGGKAFERLSEFAAERALKAKLASDILGPVQWLIVAIEKLKTPSIAAEELAKSISRTSSEVTVRFLAFGGTLEEGWISRFLATLTLLVKVEFAEAIENLFRHQRVPDLQGPMLLQLTEKLLAEFKLLQLTDPIESMNRLRRRLVMAAVLKRGIEGTYSVLVDAEPATLTLFLRDYGTLFAVLSFAEGKRSFSFFHVTQRADKETLEAIHFNKEFSHLVKTDSNHYLSFRLTPSGDQFDILGRFFDGAVYRSVSGKQSARYIAQFGPGEEMESLTGNYRGTVEGRLVELSLTHLEESIHGQLSHSGTRIGLTEAFWERSEASLFLTSGETETDPRIHHVRGRFSAGGMFFRGVFILGGSGIQFPMELVKVAD